MMPYVRLVSHTYRTPNSSTEVRIIIAPVHVSFVKHVLRGINEGRFGIETVHFL